MEPVFFWGGLSVVTRLIVGGAMLWAGTAKLNNAERFAQSVQDILPVSSSVARRVARAIPLLEIVLGSMLILGFVVQWAGLAVLFLLSGFTAAIIVNVMRGQRAVCLCFGIETTAFGWRTVRRNFSLMILTVGVVLAHASGPLSRPDFETATSTELGVEVAALLVLAVAAWLLIGELLTYLGRVRANGRGS